MLHMCPLMKAITGSTISLRNWLWFIIEQVVVQLMMLCVHKYNAYVKCVCTYVYMAWILLVDLECCVFFWILYRAIEDFVTTLQHLPLLVYIIKRISLVSKNNNFFELQLIDVAFYIQIMHNTRQTVYACDVNNFITIQPTVNRMWAIQTYCLLFLIDDLIVHRMLVYG